MGYAAQINWWVYWGDTLGSLEDIFGVHKLLYFFTLSVWTLESFVGIAYQGKILCLDSL